MGHTCTVVLFTYLDIKSFHLADAIHNINWVKIIQIWQNVRFYDVSKSGTNMW